MSLTGRDRRIVLAAIPVVIVIAYWFLLLAPTREQAAMLGQQVAKEQQRRDAAVAAVADLRTASGRFATDYTEIVRLGKAIPSTVDVPSLLVQLDAAARGTGVAFGDIKVGDRVPAPTGLGGAPAGQPAAGAASSPASTPAPPATSAQGSTAPAPAGQAAPAGGQAAAPASQAPGQAGGASGVPGLDTVPIELSLSGSFSELADVLHRLKRFVHVGDERVLVRGRLMTIDGFNFDASEFPLIKAEMKATAYLSPKAEGEAARATALGPGTAPPPAAGAPAAPSPPAATPPPATVSAR